MPFAAPIIRIASVVAAVSALGAPSPPIHRESSGEHARSSFPSDAVVMSLIRERIAERRSAGIVVGMLDADGSTHFLAAGDPGPGQPPLDANSVFEIGSISKVFTSTVLAQLVKEGSVSLDDPVQRYLPGTVRVPSRGSKQITLANLAEQNSGLPAMPTNFNPADAANPFADYTVAQLYDFLSSYQLPREPGAQFVYSNLGVGLLGHVLSLRTGLSYEEMERRRVWAPLGMSHTSITLTPWMRAHLARGHAESGAVVPNWDFPTLAGAGAIRSTAADLLLFAAANLHPERGALEDAMSLAHQPRAATDYPNTAIGLNWIVEQVAGNTLIAHNGGTGGYRSYLGIDLTRRVAVVVLANTGGLGEDDLARHLLYPSLPLMPKPAPPKKRTAIALPVATLSRYVGTYDMTPAFTLDVALVGDALMLHPTGQATVRLWPETETDFFITDVDAQISFVRDAHGNVSALVLHQNGANQTARRR